MGKKEEGGIDEGGRKQWNVVSSFMLMLEMSYLTDLTKVCS